MFKETRAHFLTIVETTTTTSNCLQLKEIKNNLIVVVVHSSNLRNNILKFNHDNECKLLYNSSGTVV